MKIQRIFMVSYAKKIENYISSLENSLNPSVPESAYTVFDVTPTTDSAVRCLMKKSPKFIMVCLENIHVVFLGSEISGRVQEISSNMTSYITKECGECCVHLISLPTKVALFSYLAVKQKSGKGYFIGRSGIVHLTLDFTKMNEQLDLLMP